MSRRRHITPNMHKALQRVSNVSNQKTPKRTLMRGGTTLPVKKTGGGCGCGK